ncbi:hypothetical protein [Iamia sp.]|uniref:hypothetical protein n=1 Tax=Iamia sp. TaxID=2722710 RepID=UPI002CB86CEF|nr:hypothetical protein [Iamia sp.]HXH57721.1 hypothetical protein [Iamia sp.]
MKNAEDQAADTYMASPVTDSDRLEAIFEQVASIRRILTFWSAFYGICLALVALAYFVEIT